jgi:hypothetical protein
MYDGGKIIAGLVVFVALVVSPLWLNVASGQTVVKPELKLPAGEKQCVEPAEFMRAQHMQMLMSWRDEVVREDKHIYASKAYGKSYDISLSGTCLAQCHQDKAEFCDRCHNYSGVSPNCWSCHVVPEERS